LQGSNAVAAMVCFKDGIPCKNDYRRFKIKTVVGIDDFSSMKEIVFRRYNRIIKENEPLPDLVIIDGGKGQLNAALEAINELGIVGKTTLVGLAKNKEELFFANDQQSILLDWNSDCLKLIRRIRDEVHRFGITYHRNLRSKNALENELETIYGIGETTANELLKNYKSIKKVSSAPLNELVNLIGKTKAEIIASYFKKKSLNM
jgi:excinuclease ABC subunit C